MKWIWLTVRLAPISAALLAAAQASTSEELDANDPTRLFRQNAELHCRDFESCVATRVGRPVDDLVRLWTGVITRMRQEWDQAGDLAAVVRDMSEILNQCHARRGGRPECLRDPFAGGQTRVVRGFIGMDRQACRQAARSPFQYSLRRDSSGTYHAALKLCFVAAEDPAQYAGFLADSGGTWDAALERWKTVLSSTWRSTTAPRFRSSYELQRVSHPSDCRNQDGVVQLHRGGDNPGENRSNYANWYLNDPGFRGARGDYTLKHEVGHLLGLIDEYNENPEEVSRCNADFDPGNADSLMGFAGEFGGGGMTDAQWGAIRPKRKHFKQIISNVVQNNHRSAEHLVNGFEVGYETVCERRSNFLNQMIGICGDEEAERPPTLHCESDGAAYAVDYFGRPEYGFADF